MRRGASLRARSEKDLPPGHLGLPGGWWLRYQTNQNQTYKGTHVVPRSVWQYHVKAMAAAVGEGLVLTF